MGRRPCCDKDGLNRGSWSAWEDKILSNYVELHGEGKWRDLPQKAGLKRCGKSCRLRWLNYLRPDIKRGDISFEEEELIIRLHKLLGNRWSLIAGRLPGRTDNEIKNYWNTNLSKRLQSVEIPKNKISRTRTSSPPPQPHPVIRSKAVPCSKATIPRFQTDILEYPLSKRLQYVEIPKNKISRTRTSSPPPPPQPHPVIRSKAVRCSKVTIPRFQTDILEYPSPKIAAPTSEEPSSSPLPQMGETADFLMDFDMDGLLTCDALNSFLDEGENNNGDFLVPKIEDEEGMLHGILNPYETLELHSLASFLDSEDEWITENNKVS